MDDQNSARFNHVSVGNGTISETDSTYEPLIEPSTTTPEHVPWHHYSTFYYRAIILFLASFMCTGLYMSYDSIGAVAPYLKGEMEISGREYGVLVAVYSLPNVILCFIGGILTDKFGWQKTSLVFSFFIILGNFIIAVSTSYSAMVVGRFVCGLGGESLIVSQTVVLSQWFTGRELGVAFGLSLSLGWLGSMSSYWILPVIAANHEFRAAFWFTFGACVLSGVGNIVLILLDERAKDRPQSSDSESVSLEKGISHPLFILNLITCNFFFGAMTIIYNMTSYLVEVYGYDEETAARITSLNYVFAIVLSPFFGYIVDTMGRRNTLLMCGLITLPPTFLLLTFTDMNPIILVISMGLSYALVPSVVYTAIPLIVHPRYTARAFGINYSAYDFMIFVTPIVFGHFYDTTGSYTAGLILLTFQTFIALLATFAFWLIDWKYYDSFMQLPSKNPPTSIYALLRRLKKLS